ncbi:MAG: hypothetical protein JWM20_357 [Patescibacteria group bacterium]|nr:hypothetical protein [Patescibacteria group bacterium]
MKKLFILALCLTFALPAFAQTANLTLQQKLQSDGIYSSVTGGQLSGPLRRGMKGDQRINTLQIALRDAGYFYGIIDGSYGRVTQASVMSFQSAHGLSADGTWGPRSLAAFLAMIGTPTANQIQTTHVIASTQGTQYQPPIQNTNQPSCGNSRVDNFNLVNTVLNINSNTNGTVTTTWSGCNIHAPAFYHLVPISLDLYGGTQLDQNQIASNNAINPTISGGSATTSAGTHQLSINYAATPSGTYTLTAFWNINGQSIMKSMQLRVTNASFTPSVAACTFSATQEPTYSINLSQGANQSAGEFQVTSNCSTPLTIGKLVITPSGTAIPPMVSMMAYVFVNGSPVYQGSATASYDSSISGYAFSNPAITIPSGSGQVELFKFDADLTGSGTPVGTYFQLNLFNRGDLVLYNSSQAAAADSTISYPVTTAAAIAITN